MEYLVMLPGPTNVPNKVMNAMLEPIINHRSDDFRMRLADLIESWGGQAIRVKSPFGENPPFEKIEEAFDQNKDVKAIYAVYNETSTGTTIRYMDKLGKLCSKNGTFFVADAVSILGGDELPVDKWNIDICVTASQ